MKYFISYAHRKWFFIYGFGTAVGNFGFDPLEDIAKTAKYIEESNNVKNVVLINVMRIE